MRAKETRERNSEKEECQDSTQAGQAEGFY
jgi:hypothetical protein